MLFYCVFQTFHRKKDSLVILKSLNPEGPLGSYLCDVTLPALSITCQFLFCGTKKINRIFYQVKKNLIFLSFLWSIFIVPVFLCSFITPFTEDSIIFIKSIFNILLFLIVDFRHVFTTFLLIVMTVVFSLNVVHNHSNIYLVLFVPGYLLI